jgi:hypothetical protein
MLNPFMHSEIQFKQQKIEILSKFTSPDSGQKTQKVERLAKPKNEPNIQDRTILKLYYIKTNQFTIFTQLTIEKDPQIYSDKYARLNYIE